MARLTLVEPATTAGAGDHIFTMTADDGNQQDAGGMCECWVHVISKAVSQMHSAAVGMALLQIDSCCNLSTMISLRAETMVKFSTAKPVGAQQRQSRDAGLLGPQKP